MILSIGLYTLIWIATSLIVRRQYIRRERITDNHEIDSTQYAKKKLNIMAILIVALLFTLYNVYVTRTSVVVGGDRQNYIANFNGLRVSPSIALTFLMQMVHRINGSIETLYYLTTFLCVVITMLAYRISKDATPQSFVLLCATQYFLTTLTALKQCYASALAALVFVLLLEYKSKKTDVLALICILLACLFHTTGYVLIPMFIIIKVPKSKINLFLYSFVLLVLAFAFEPAMLALARIVSPIVPQLGNQLLSYFADTSEFASEGIATSFIKGLPYYFITVYGILKRNILKDKIKNYDNYLLVVGTGAFLYFMSIYSGWLSRFIYTFCFVSFVLFGLMMKEVRITSNRVIYKAFVFLSLTVVTYRFLYLVYTLWGGF